MQFARPLGTDAGGSRWSADGGGPNIEPMGPIYVRCICYNGDKDPNETDFDCGGNCAPCALGHGCVMTWRTARRGTCVSNVCTGAGQLLERQASDGNETDVDCGGADCPGCADGKKCRAGGDCTERDLHRRDLQLSGIRPRTRA